MFLCFSYEQNQPLSIEDALDDELVAISEHTTSDGITTFNRELPRSATPREDPSINEDVDGVYTAGLAHGLTPVSNTIEDDEVQRETQSAFYGDNITLNPVKEDLSKKETTCMIFDYIWNVGKKIVKRWYDEYMHFC